MHRHRTIRGLRPPAGRRRGVCPPRETPDRRATALIRADFGLPAAWLTAGRRFVNPSTRTCDDARKLRPRRATASSSTAALQTALFVATATTTVRTPLTVPPS